MFGANTSYGKGMREVDAVGREKMRGRGDGKRGREDMRGEDAGRGFGEEMRGGGLFANNKFVLRKFNIFSLGFSGYIKVY